ncbi:MAG: hypothetical protein ABI231_10405 [Candidatus Tumulicola sp.]
MMQKMSRVSRVGATLAVLAMLTLNAVLSERYRLTPIWLPWVAAAIMLGPIIVGRFVRNSSVWRGVERVSMMTSIFLLLLLNTLNLADVVDEVLFHSGGIVAETLFLTSISIWAANMLGFTLLYWEIDRGGPDARVCAAPGYPDFGFPAYTDPMVLPGWQPTFLDYLFIGFTTSTAFGPTEAMPLTPRAKGLMMVQSVISLVTIIVVAARAIGIIR